MRPSPTPSPREYARCSAAATVAAPVRVSSAIATAAAVSQASSAPSARYSAPNAAAQQPRPDSPGEPARPAGRVPVTTAAGATSARSRSRALVDEMRDQVALHRGQRHQQRRPGQRHRQDDDAARCAQVARRRLEQHRKAHHEDGAGAGGGDRVRRTAQERRPCCPGSAAAAAARVAGEAISRISHATEPATVAHRYPTSPQPDQERRRRHGHPQPGVGRPSATRTAVHRFTPASMPSSVACRQNPASPTPSSATLTAIAIRRTHAPTTAAS